jgi:transposase
MDDSWLKLFKSLNEVQKRLFAALKAKELGYGGISKVSKLSGLSKTTITKGIQELEEDTDFDHSRIRASGAGRKRILDSSEELKKRLEEILCETTAGDPMSAIKWTCKSVRSIADTLRKEGFKLERTSVHNILLEMGYSLQSNRKSLSRADHPERDRQFKLINRKVKKFLREGIPVISVDAKKKELIGKFENKGKQWRPKFDPVLVEDHDFSSRADGKGIPYGTHDVGKNQGFVNIGISADTADFAVNSILRWWQEFGSRNYPNAEKILICADGGGSNGSRNRLWKYNLQRFADKTGLEIHVCHYPPGTSKWNKIEHRMFSYISSHWRGQPLESYEAVIQLIGNTTTKSGLELKAKLDKRRYKKGKKIADDVFNAINLTENRILPKWNYSITPY